MRKVSLTPNADVVGDLLRKSLSGSKPEVQLSLFDDLDVNRLVCLPMGSLHGNTFMRIVSNSRPKAVVDVRRHPYFALSSLSRESAFKLFKHTPTEYLHHPLDLRQPPDQKERWRLRNEAMEFLSAIAPGSAGYGMTFIVLMHASQEASVFDAAIRRTRVPGQPGWVVEQV